MASTQDRNKNLTRPKKSPGARARRQRLQKKRLVAMGFPQEVADKMSARQILTKLKYPKKLAAELAEQNK